METTKNKIVPHLWFDTQAKEAVDFYVSLFPNSKVIGKTAITDTPSGDVDIITFDLLGNRFMAINAGPMFKFNPSVSFYVYCGSDDEIEGLYKKLLAGGKAIISLDKYPWSSKYAWVQDKYGVTWQLDISDINSQQKILPSLLFTNDRFDKVKDAVDFYSEIFPDSKIILEATYHESVDVPKGTLLFAQYKLNGYLINSMSSNLKHDFDFNESISLMIHCDSQDEVDYYWKNLTHDGQEQPCGWVKDKYGVSWQVVPAEMNEMMLTTDKEQLNRVTRVMLQMTKLDIKTLRQAYNNQ